MCWMSIHVSDLSRDLKSASSLIYIPPALKPFYADNNGNFHTSVSARNLSVFGYTYQELQSGNPGDVRAAINTLYGDTGSTSTKRSVSGLGALKGFNVTNPPSPSEDDTTQLPREYLVNVSADKLGQNGSYFIRIFLGEFTPNSQDWSRDPNLVGTHSIFSKTMAADTPRAQMPITGVVPLTKSLERAYQLGKIDGLTENIVVPYLTPNLHWRAQNVSAFTNGIKKHEKLTSIFSPTVPRSPANRYQSSRSLS
jgi:tyrosinase